MAGVLGRSGLYLLLLWAPLPLASNRPVFWAINGVAAAVLAALFIASELSRSRGRRPDFGPIVPAVLVVALLGGWMLVQALVPVPADLREPLVRDLSFASGAPNTISVNPGRTLDAVLQALTPVIIAFLAFRLARRKSRSDWLVLVFGLGAGALAIYGFIAKENGFQPQLFGDWPATDGLTGTFVNRDIAGTYWAMACVAVLAQMLGRLERVRGDRKSALGDIASVPAVAGLHLLLVILLAAAVVASGSRAGVAALAVGIVVVVGASLARGTGAGRVTALAVIAACLTVFLAIGVAAGTLFGRLDPGALDASWQTRATLYGDVIDAILARPLVGYGAGTFVDFFPMFHSPELDSGVVWTTAHNSFLQFAAELGLPAFLLLVGFIAALAIAAARTVLTRLQPAPTAVAALGVLAVVGTHALFDAPLQTQAISLSFTALLGAGVGESARLRRDLGTAGSGRDLRAELDVVEVYVPAHATRP